MAGMTNATALIDVVVLAGSLAFGFTLGILYGLGWAVYATLRRHWKQQWQEEARRAMRSVRLP